MPHLMPLIVEPDDRTQGGMKFFSVEVAGEHAYVKWSPAINELISRKSTSMKVSIFSGLSFHNWRDAISNGPPVEFSHLQMNTSYDFSITLYYRETASSTTFVYKLNSVRVTTLPHCKSPTCFSISLGV